MNESQQNFIETIRTIIREEIQQLKDQLNHLQNQVGTIRTDFDQF